MNRISNILSKRRFSSLTNDDKIRIKELGRPMPDLDINYVQKSGKTKRCRKFNRNLYSKNKWLSGCEEKCALFCFPCVLFGGEFTWSKGGITDIAHIWEKMKAHEKNKVHMNNVMNLSMVEKGDGLLKSMPSLMVSLACDGHHTALVSVFVKLLDGGKLVDCTIAAEGQKLKAHKEVLSAFSPYFELLFREETENNPTIILSGINFRDLRSLVYFMYHGKLEVPENRIQDLIDVAECLKIKGLGAVHKKEGPGKANKISSLRNLLVASSGIPHKRTRKVQSEEAANMLSEEANVNDSNNKNLSLPHRNSSNAPNTHLSWQSSVQNTMHNIDVQNVSTERNMPFIHAHSTFSSMEINNSHLNDVSEVKIEPSLGGFENVMEPMRIASGTMSLCERQGNSFEHNGDSVLGLPSDVSVTGDINHCKELSSGTPNLQLCSGDLLSFSVKKLDNNNTTLFLPCVDHTVSAEKTQNLFLHSELLVKTEPSAEDESSLLQDDNSKSNIGACSETTLQGTGVPTVSVEEMLTERNDECGAQNLFIHSELILKTEPNAEGDILLPEDDNLRTNYGESSESTLQSPSASSASVEEMVVEQNNERESAYSDAASRCAEEELVPFQEKLPAVAMETEGRGINKSADTVLPELFAETSKAHAHPPATCLSHATPCQSDLLGPSGSESQMQSSSIKKQYTCRYCSGVFTQMFSLKRHYQTAHLKLKPNKCRECDFTTAQSSSLKRHQIIHSGIKPYKWKECDYTTAHSGNLKKHK